MKMMRRGCIGSAGGSIFCRRVLQGQKAETREALLVHRVDRQMCRRSQFLSGKLGSKEKRERGRRRNFEVSLMMRTAAGTMSGGASCGLTVMDGWSRRIRNRNVSDTVAKAVRRGHQGCVCEYLRGAAFVYGSLAFRRPKTEDGEMAGGIFGNGMIEQSSAAWRVGLARFLTCSSHDLRSR